MDADKASFIRGLTTDLTARRFRVSPPGELQPATGWDSDLDVLAGGVWMALFVVTDTVQLDRLEWLENRRYTPGRPPRPFALLSLVPVPVGRVEGVPVFDFSNYGSGLTRLTDWLGGLPASGGERRERETGGAAQLDTTTAASASAGEEQPFAAIEELERFDMSREAWMIVRFARALADFHVTGSDILFSELLVFAAAESGRVNPRRSAGHVWRTLQQAAGAEYAAALTHGFPQWVPGTAEPPTSTIRKVSRNTLAVLTGAEHIARRTTGHNHISARHLIGALYVVLPTDYSASVADSARTFGFPDIRHLILEYLPSVMPTDNREEWDAIVSRKWTISELESHDPVGTQLATDDAVRVDRTVGVRAASLSDGVATSDRLGFEPYVNAVATFITSGGTKPPLTLAVEGEWGSGKSSFMCQLRKTLRAGPDGKEPVKAGVVKWLLANLNPRHDPGRLTVWFNPWRHDREEALWAAFALEFLREISGQLPWARRWWGHLKLLCTRFSWRDGWWEFARTALLAVLAATALGILATVVLDGPGFEQLFTAELQSEKGKGLVGTLLKVGGGAGTLALAVSLLKEVKSFVGNPLRVDLKQYVQSPDYQARISFIEQFHRDFGKMVAAYAGDRTVFVFIDDLDRCQVPRAADLMQALNLMTAGDQPLVFIIGMDREKIAASLAVKFKDVIPYIGGPESLIEMPWANADATAGVEFGSEFIEKFVQLSIRVPQPRPSDITRLLEDLSPTARDGSSRHSAAAAPATGAEAVSPAPAAVTPGSVEPPARPSGPAPGSPPPVPAPAVVEARRALRRDVSVDSPRLHDIVRLVAPALDYNPRRVKQFINACRLHAYIAIETDLIADEDGSPASGLSFEILGKFVAIALRWPLLVTHLENEPGLLQRLESIALGKVSSAVAIDVFWASRPRLMELLRAKLNGTPGETPSRPDALYAFEGVDIAQLLRVTTGAPAGTSAIPLADAVQSAGSPPVPWASA